jgi:heat-inducible transcriptional repressor
MVMDERKKNILHAIIQDYIATAEPVGSRSIAQKYNVGVSSATIRNEMADLEEMGFIEQLHTSSGRVPSDKGYRFYVDFLMKKMDISPPEEQFIHGQLKENIQHMEDLFKKTSDVLSQITNYIALAVGPQVSETAVQQIQLLPMQNNKVLLMIISDKGVVDNGIMNFPGDYDKETMAIVSEILSCKLKGHRLKDISKTVLQEIYYELADYKKLVTLVLDFMDDALKVSDKAKVYTGGMLNILNQPEFKDVEALRSLLSVMEEQAVLRQVLKETSSEAGLAISIGGENKHKSIHNCSIITATYEVGGRVIGTVGILGPTRMAYPKAATTIEFVSKCLSDILEGQNR